MIYTKEDVKRELERYFAEDVEGNNDDIVTKIKSDIDKVCNQSDVLNACKMIKDSFGDESENCNDDVNFKTMFVLAVATSIDALAVGITFAFLQTNILLAALAIGIITFAACVIGVKIGNKFGDKYERKAETVGGLILILMGIKILLEHLGIL